MQMIGFLKICLSFLRQKNAWANVSGTTGKLVSKILWNNCFASIMSGEGHSLTHAIVCDNKKFCLSPLVGLQFWEPIICGAHIPGSTMSEQHILCTSLGEREIYVHGALAAEQFWEDLHRRKFSQSFSKNKLLDKKSQTYKTIAIQYLLKITYCKYTCVVGTHNWC